MWDKMETPTIVYDLDTSGGLMEVRLDCSEAHNWVKYTPIANALWFLLYYVPLPADHRSLLSSISRLANLIIWFVNGRHKVTLPLPKP